MVDVKNSVSKEEWETRQDLQHFIEQFHILVGMI